MSGHNIGKKSNHKYKRTEKHSKDFNRRQQKEHPHRNTRHCKNVMPVISVCTYRCYNKCKKRQRHGDGNIACYVGATRNYRYDSKQVQKQDEEENREQERHVLLI